MRVLVFGASGTIGRAVLRALVAAGHDAVGFVRPAATGLDARFAIRRGTVTDAASIRRDAFAGEQFDAVISCLASRSGTRQDARRIDYRANRDILGAARLFGVDHMILLSAICVQKPRLAFQHAKLAFEEELMASGLTWTIVRPTAFFKSLSGQVARVRNGKPFLLFGDGNLTRCKPIGDDDLARYLVACLTDAGCQDRVLPIGGPGPAQSPREQAEDLFALLDRPPRFRSVPVGLLDAAVALLGAGGRLSQRLADKAEYARIGRYYATESMLVLDPATGRYDADATPETGSMTLRDHHAQLIARGD